MAQTPDADRVEIKDLHRYVKAQSDVQQSRERFAAIKQILTAQVEAAEALADLFRLKYQLEPKDSISDDGTITRARAVPPAPADDPEASEG